MFIQFKDVDGDLAVVRIDTIKRILVTKDKRYVVQFLDGSCLELTQESAQALADRLTEV